MLPPPVEIKVAVVVVVGAVHVTVAAVLVTLLLVNAVGAEGDASDVAREVLLDPPYPYEPP